MGDIHQRWTTSGRGDGIKPPDSEDPVDDNEAQQLTAGGREKIDFVLSDNSAAMYLWFHLLEHDLFQHAASSLPPEFQADGDVHNFSAGSSRSSKKKGSKASGADSGRAAEQMSNQIGKLITTNQRAANAKLEQSHKQNMLRNYHLSLQGLRQSRVFAGSRLTDLHAVIQTAQKDTESKEDAIFALADAEGSGCTTFEPGSYGILASDPPRMRILKARYKSAKVSLDDLEAERDKEKQNLADLDTKIVQLETKIEDTETDMEHEHEDNTVTPIRSGMATAPQKYSAMSAASLSSARRNLSSDIIHNNTGATALHGSSDRRRTTRDEDSSVTSRSVKHRSSNEQKENSEDSE
jgi:hypothetical protein